MKIADFMKGVFRSLFPLKDIKTALGVKVSMSEEMLNAIEVWQNCYSGRAEWLNGNVHSLRLEQSIAREFANIVLTEMTASVSNERLNDIFITATQDLNMYLQHGLATGAMVIKPLGVGDRVQYVAANAFLPVEYNSRGRLLKVIFPEFKKLNGRYYTRLEYHDSDPVSGLTITNTAYMSSSEGSLGREINLTDVEEWASLPRKVRYPMMNRPAFGYYRNPIKNNIDGSHCGVSVFDSALPLIAKADIQFSRLDWEFESGERVITVDDSALIPTKIKSLPKLNDRLYRGLNISGEDFYKEFSPQFRQADITAGLDEYKRNIEFEVGLSYGDISNPQSVAKTATEIKASKARKYNTVNAIQCSLKNCLDDLVYALAFYNSMTTSNYEFSCGFKDSILTDEETERKQDIQDVSIGAMPIWEYRAKWYNEDEITAKNTVGCSAEVVE